MDTKTRQLIDRGEYLFSAKKSMMALCQEIAEIFYVERAQFTANWWIGRNFADNLTSSDTLIVRRDLGNTFSQMTRPSDQQWFEIGTARPDLEDDAAKKWLENRTLIQRRAMYDTQSNYVRAMSELDHDYVTFGNAIRTCVLNKNGDGLVFKCWHFRDVAWAENSEFQAHEIHRKWKPTVSDLISFGKQGWKISDKLEKIKDKEPFREVNCRHVVLPTDQYEPANGNKKPNTPFVSVFLDEENNQTMVDAGTTNTIYNIRRWLTVSGSQYAYSPCTMAALPDGRLYQALTLILLEAGEKAVTPPMITPADVLRSDIQLFANGITTYDAEYDEKTGEVLRPIPIETSGLGFGAQLRAGVMNGLKDAFYLNKIGLPPIGRDMTAFEVGQRVSEYVRNALPLFQPSEIESAAENELIFDVIRQAGGFGSDFDIPQSIRGAEIKFKITSPLAAAIDSQKGQKFLQMKAMLAEGAALDPTCPAMVNAQKAMRDALLGVGTPADWMNSKQEMAAAQEKIGKAADMQQQLAAMGQGADVANKVGTAAQNLGLLPPPGTGARPGTQPATGA